MEDKQVS